MAETSQPHPGASSGDPAEEWYRRPAEVVLQRLGSSVDGLSSAEAARRPAEVGPNELARPDKPSVLKLALVQLHDPMNPMLLVVLVVSLVIGQGSTAGVVGFLVLLNVMMGPTRSSRPRTSSPWTGGCSRQQRWRRRRRR